MEVNPYGFALYIFFSQELKEKGFSSNIQAENEVL